METVVGSSDQWKPLFVFDSVARFGGKKPTAFHCTSLSGPLCCCSCLQLRPLAERRLQPGRLVRQLRPHRPQLVAQPVVGVRQLAQGARARGRRRASGAVKNWGRSGLGKRFNMSPPFFSSRRVPLEGTRSEFVFHRQL